jgi:acyl dehydratase
VSSLLTDEIKAMVGREVSYTAPEEIGRASIRYFALAIGDDNPLYTDAEFAMANGYPSVIAPPTFICETNQYMNQRPDAMGYIGHRWQIPIEGCRELRGGHEYEFLRPVVPTDRITATWRIAGVQERNSSRGTPMLFLYSEAVYTNQEGERLAVNRETIIYQPVSARA